jgi:hypothetical protein
MDKQAKNHTKDWREARRERAWELKQKDWKQKDIAGVLSVIRQRARPCSTWIDFGKKGLKDVQSMMMIFSPYAPKKQAQNRRMK